MLFILRFFFDLVIFIYIVSICVCVNRTIDRDLHVLLDGSSFWANWHHYILYSTRHSSLPEKEHTRMYNFFQSLNVIDKIIIIFIHSWLVSMVTDERESHMLHHDIWLLWTFL